MAVVQVAMKQETQSPPPAPNPPPSPPPATSGPSTGHVIPRDPLGLEERILTLCAQNAKGITDDIIVQDQPTIDGEKRMRAHFTANKTIISALIVACTVLYCVLLQQEV